MGRGDARSDSDESVQWEEFFGPSLDISGSLLAMYDSLASELRSDGSSCPPPTRPPPAARRPLSSSSDCSSSSSSSSSLLPPGLGGVKKSYLASVESLEDDVPAALRGNRALCRTTFADNSAVAMHRSLLSHPHGGNAGCGPDQPSYLDRVLLEVVDTERTYVRDIGAIVEGYLKPLPLLTDSKIKPEELKSLFGNIESIYAFNSGFLEQLEKCGFDPVSIARCFVANSSGFSVYTEFCTSYPTMVSTLTELVGKAETAEIFKARQTSLHHSLPLGSYLLKPVQRILKYHLLLQNIVKHVDKESPGYPDVKNALSVMTGIAYHINDMKRRHEHAVRVQEIQSLLYGWQGEDLTTFGELVAEGCFRMLGAKALRHLFLFDKMLLVAKKREQGILHYKTHVVCSNLMLIESIQGEPLCFQVVPFNSPDYQYSFQARNLEQKREWCLQLKRAIIESFSAVIPSHAKQLVLELGQNDRGLLCERGPVKKTLGAPEYLKRRRYDRRKSESSLHRALQLSRGSRKVRSTTYVQSWWGVAQLQWHLRRRCPPCLASLTSSTRLLWDSPPPPPFFTLSRIALSAKQGSHNTGFQGLTLKIGRRIERTLNSKVKHVVHNMNARRMYFTVAHDALKRSCACYRNCALQARLTKSCSCQPVSCQRISTLDPAEFQCCPEYTQSGTATTSSQNLGPSSPTSPRSDTSCYAGKPEARTVERLESRSSSEEPWPPWKQCPRTSVDTSDTENEDGACMVDVRRLLRYRPSVRSPSYHSEEIPGEYVTFEFASRHISEQSYGATYCTSAGTDFTALWARLGAHAASIPSSSKLVQRSHSFSEAALPETDCPERSKAADLRRVKRENSVPEDWLNSLEEHLPPNACKRCGSLPRSFRHGTPTSPSSETGSKMHQLRARMERLRLQAPEQRPFTIASDQPSRADFIDGPGSYMPQGNHSSQFSSQELNPVASVENLASSVVHPEHRIYRRDTLHGGSWRNTLLGLGTKLTRVLWSPNLNNGPARNAEGQLSHGSSRDSVRSNDSRLAQLKAVGSFSRACASVIQSKARHLPRFSSLHGVQGNSTAAARIARQREPDYCIPQTILAILNKNESGGNTGNLQPEADSSPKPVPLIPHLANAVLELDDDTDSENSDSSADSYYERNFEAIEDVLADDMFRDSAIYSDPEEVSGSEHEVAVKPGLLARRANSNKLQAVAEKLPPHEDSSQADQQQASAESSLCTSSPGPAPVACRQRGWVKHIVDKFQANMASNS
ncbi:uncharacterized protein LOC119457490 [Dermacentor silvarum]|uniref:uncharacterized protein LOC119457490 n=1 Tax=Dermacentor silvarum TaxID=543639 RepID=UPI002100C2CC|nr:uncharacterized protein LOC119457490 [Dermacentor silvarum]